MSIRDQARAVARQARRVRDRHKSPDISTMPGIKYKHNGSVDTWRYFKDKSRRKKFLRETDIDDYEIINND